MSTAAEARAPSTLPALCRVTARRAELADTVTLDVDPGRAFDFAPGQFNMLYVHGIGEVPISISGDPARSHALVHTVRAVGAVSRALCALAPGDQVGVRGPYGRGWPLAGAAGQDVVVIAGGIGLAPLRPALYRLLAERADYTRVSLLYGGRSPDLLLYPHETTAWQARGDIDVAVTVDAADRDWHGQVGVVTRLIAKAVVDPARTVVFVCGPEIMMRFCVAELLARGVAASAIHLSLERNMQCAVGLCGHCQYGGDFICRDGAVFAYSRIADRFRVREL